MSRSAARHGCLACVARQGVSGKKKVKGAAPQLRSLSLSPSFSFLLPLFLIQCPFEILVEMLFFCFLPVSASLFLSLSRTKTIESGTSTEREREDQKETKKKKKMKYACQSKQPVLSSLALTVGSR